MEINRKNQSFHSLLTAISILLHFWAQVNKAQDDYLGKEFHVGVILDMGSLEWEIVHNCMSMAIYDFYDLHNDYATRVVLHARDTKGGTLRALHAALDLLGNTKVEAIIGAQTSVEANFLAELGDKAKVPVISFFAPIPHSSLAAYPYFIQVKEGDTSQVNGIAAIIENFKWKHIIFIHEDTDEGRDILPYLVDKFQKKNIHISYKIAISASSKGNEILEELHKVMASQDVVFVVHLSYLLASSLCINAKRLGMMGEGYAWIMTSKSMNDLHFMNSSVIQAMQGVIGLRSHIPASEELDNFTSRWREKIQTNHSNLGAMAPGVSGVRAYDVCWSLARAAERVRYKAPVTKNPENNFNLWDLDSITTSGLGPILLKEILQSGVQGLSGKNQFIKGKLAANTFEIVNVIGRGERTVGFWSSEEKLTRELQSSHNGKVLSSNSKLEDIIWPGGSANIPEGRMMRMSNKKLRVGIPVKTGFTSLVDIKRDPQTNETTATGFCVDVFKAAIEALSYPLQYEFIPFEGNVQRDEYYDELVYQVYLQNFDAVVGDVTIMANRSLYVDFTVSYTDLGVGMIIKNGSNMWIFLRPLTADLWLTSAAFFIFTGFIIWAIERPTNDAFQGSPLQQIATVVWFSFSTLTFAQRERLLSNLSKFILIVWLFAVLILTSSYTATLASMLTVQQINLASKEINIGYQSGSFMPGFISNLNFEDYRLKPYTLDGYAEALSRGSKSGGVSAIIDEMPYIKAFLSKYAGDGYSIAGRVASANGFGFVFPKGSPLVPEISRQIMALREEGKLRRMESAWFPIQPALLNDDGSATSNNLSALNLDNFGGLFIITGSTSCLAILIFFIFKLHKQWQVLRNYDLGYLFQKGYEVVNTCFNGRIRSRAQETSVL